MIISAAGNLDHERVRELVLEAFAGLAVTGDVPNGPAPRSARR